jgi:hypothetical protein
MPGGDPVLPLSPKAQVFEECGVGERGDSPWIWFIRLINSLEHICVHQFLFSFGHLANWTFCETLEELVS